ncbi:hypothetical protein Q7P37_003958 [Cladosporium fusiforme]
MPEMEKRTTLSSTPPHRHPHERINDRSPWKWLTAIICGACLVWYIDIPRLKILHFSSTESTPERPGFNWYTSPVHDSLNYSPCYSDLGDFQCARLALPLDYWNGTTDKTLSLAVVRKPAVVPVTDPRYAGAFIVNPGGPGGSGIDYVVGAWKMLQHTVDSPDLDDTNGKYFDIVSFDPRGVGFSTPNVHCFTDPALDQGWQLRVMEEGVLGASDATFGRLWSMAIARAGSCSLPLEDGKDIKPYVTTAHTARDMLELVEKHGEWREAEAERAISMGETGCSSHNRSNRPVDIATIREKTKYTPGEEKIVYSGGSYGTYLGLTFASMFPDRIGRLRVDGLVDGDDYRRVRWTDNLQDTEKEMQQFYHYCAQAGYPTCSLANSTGKTTSKSVEARVKNATNSLLHNPLPVIGANPEVITYSDAKHLIFASLYSPMVSFPIIANLLAGFEQGDGSLFAELLRPYHQLTCPVSPESAGNASSLTPYNKATGVLAPDSTMAIACADGDDQSWMTKSQYSAYWKRLAKLSPTIGPMWAMFRMYCIHYSVRPAYRFTAPFEANASHPILLIGNTADPVTPLANAFKMSKGFPGSVVLTQNSAGHTSGSVYSSCTVNHIREYFQAGVLPAEGTVCEPDEVPFGAPSGAVGAAGEYAESIKIFREGNAAMLRSAGGGLPGISLGARLGLAT